MRFHVSAAMAAFCLAQAVLTAQAAPPDRIDVLAAGDVIPHQTVLNAAFDKASGGYDFRPPFSYVKDYIQTADLAICNVETVFTGDGSYSGYPSFDSPDVLAANLAEVGFDVGVTANNHMMDQGARGFDGTIDALRRGGLTVAGTRKPGEPRYAMAAAKGRKVAVIAYTFMEYDRQGALSFNTIRVPAELLPRINYFTVKELQAGIAQIRSVVEAARAAGAELVICYYHWGTEYEMAPNAAQQALAKATADMGVDLILGDHPHVIQKALILRSSAGKDLPVYYSLGNLLSNQRLDTMDNRFAEDGLLALVGFEAPSAGGLPRLVSAQALATWVYKRQDDLVAFEIIPFSPGLGSNPTVVSRNLMPKLDESLAATKKALGPQAFDEASMRFTFFGPGAAASPGGGR
jgi:poly-gamma-glutamate synthesis protein (capsule biosynthesis protein)